MDNDNTYLSNQCAHENFENEAEDGDSRKLEELTSSTKNLIILDTLLKLPNLTYF